MRLESARNLLAFSYNVYCGALSKYQIELQRMLIELHRKSPNLQTVASQNPEGPTDSMVPKTNPESESSADISKHLFSQKATEYHDLVRQPLFPMLLRTTWAEYFAGSVTYREGVLKQQKLCCDRVDGQKHMWQFRIRFPSWWKTQIWDVHVIQAQSGWTNSFKVYNIVPDNSLQFEYARNDQVELLHDLFITGKASPNDINQYGESLLRTTAFYHSTRICCFLLKSGCLFEQDRGLQAGSAISEFCFGELRPYNSNSAETFELLLKHTESTLIDDDISNALTDKNVHICLPYLLPGLYLQSFFDFHNIRDTILLEYRLVIANILIIYSGKLIVIDLDEVIRKLNLILGNDGSRLKGLRALGPYSEVLVACSTRLFAHGIENRHQEAINQARKYLKMAIELKIGVSELELLTNAIQTFHEALLNKNYSSFASFDAEEALIMWVTELFTTGLDLKRYGEQQKNHKIKIRFPHNCLLPYLGQAEAIVVSGLLPTDWKIYWSTPMDEFSGAFWCMIEKPFGVPMPGSWKEERWRKNEVFREEDGIYHWWESEDWNDWTLGLI